MPAGGVTTMARERKRNGGGLFWQREKEEGGGLFGHEKEGGCSVAEKKGGSCSAEGGREWEVFSRRRRKGRRWVFHGKKGACTAEERGRLGLVLPQAWPLHEVVTARETPVPPPTLSLPQ